MDPIQPRPLVFEVWVMPEMGQSPGSRFLCLGPRTHTVRTKGASFCFKAPAARLPQRNISATATLDLLSPFFSRTDRQVKHSGPRPATRLAPFTRTPRKLLLPAPGGHWTVMPACQCKGKGSATGGLLRRLSTQRRIAIGPHEEKICACA